jgi:DNA-directed RNA polymerase subunit L
MNVNVLKKTSDELRIEVEGSGHTLCNLIQTKLLEEEDVDLAGYDVPHPLASSPVIYVRTKNGMKPETVLKNALEKARGMNKEFGKQFEKALKEK